jgi:hypothetical protein
VDLSAKWGLDIKSDNIVSDYQNAYDNGWQGLMPWTSNGVDSNGNLDNHAPGSRYMRDKYRELIFPWEIERHDKLRKI